MQPRAGRDSIPPCKMQRVWAAGVRWGLVQRPEGMLEEQWEGWGGGMSSPPGAAFAELCFAQ